MKMLQGNCRSSDGNCSGDGEAGSWLRSPMTSSLFIERERGGKRESVCA